MRFSTVRLAMLAVACSAAASLAQTVTPPPLPPGANRVRVDPGLNEVERKRYVRAHHHRGHHKKDYMRDDSVHGHADAQPGPKPGAAPGTGKK